MDKYELFLASSIHINTNSDDMCLIRYLRARDFNLPKAKEMIMETLEWRDEYKPFNVTRQDVLPILEIRSMYRNGMDKVGRPIIYVKPSYNPHSVEERIQSLVYILEEATLSMRSLETGVEKMCWILDFEAETKVKKRSADGTTVARQTIHLLQSHYPERLGIAFVLNAPWYMRMLWKIVSVFMHSVTRNKFIFLTGSKDDISRELLQHIDEAELESW